MRPVVPAAQAGAAQWCRRLMWPMRLLPLLFSARLGPSALAQGVESGAAMDLNHVAQVLAYELERADQKSWAPMLGFELFQDELELGCYGRLATLMNRTVVLRDELRLFHHDHTGIAGMFAQFLQASPAENSWVWYLMNSRERVLNEVNAYFSKVIALALSRQECLMTSMRRVLLDAVVKWKDLQAECLQLMWSSFAFQDYSGLGELEARPEAEGLPSVPWARALVASDAWISRTRSWLEEVAVDLFHAMEKEAPQTAALDEQGRAVRLHHQDEQGMFIPYEYLRRKMFNQWALDRGLLRGLLRHVWQPPYDGEPLTVADFGAGGGQYSTWLNETGLVKAFAFDGTQQASVISNGSVQEINLIEDVNLWRTFDWIVCLEVGEHIPKQFSKTLLQNLKRHAVRGLVMSWSDDWEGIGHVNCLSQEEFVAFVEQEAGLVLDPEATKLVKAGCEIDYISRTIAVFRSST